MNPSFLLDHPEIERLGQLDPDRDWRSFQQGEEAWVLQTHLRLAAAGFPSNLVSTAPDGGVVLFYAKQKRALARRLARLRCSVVVAIRGDLRGSLALADFEIVQNRDQADGRRCFFVPHWPQPGLVPRDATRGDRLERVAYKGYAQNLDPALRGPAWTARLAALGVEWIEDSVPFDGARTDRAALRWPDFHDVDACLAVRPAVPSRHKPPTKLYNAWLAGVPALLGPDPAFRDLRRGPLDYLEVTSPDSAVAAIRRLREEPGLYRAMVENGRDRSGGFTVAAVTGQWRELLEATLPRLARARRTSLPRRLLRRLEALRLRG